MPNNELYGEPSKRLQTFGKGECSLEINNLHIGLYDRIQNMRKEQKVDLQETSLTGLLDDTETRKEEQSRAMDDRNGRRNGD